MHFDLAFTSSASLAEGAFWAWREQELIWVDILGQTVNRFDPVTGRNCSYTLPSLVGTAVPRTDGALHLALREGFARFDPASGRLSNLPIPPEHDQAHFRFNDGKCDPAGRFLAGSLSLKKEHNTSALYLLERGNRTRRLIEGVSISNGLAWSTDGETMYYIDTLTRRIDAFDYDLATATPTRRRPAVEIPEALGYPDGMTIDIDGCLWVALWGGSAIIRCDPKRGSILERIPLPVSLVTSCAFGGKNFDTLFVTSARCDLDSSARAQQPLAGSILALDLKVSGIPSNYFEAAND